MTDKLTTAMHQLNVDDCPPEMRAEILQKHKFEGRPLFFAVDAGNLAAVEFLVQHRKHFPVDEVASFIFVREADGCTCKTHSTALHFAIEKSEWKIARLLLHAGASPVAQRTHDQETPLMCSAKQVAKAGRAVHNGPAYTVVVSDGYDEARSFLTHLLKHHEMTPLALGNALHAALSPRWGSATEVAGLLLEAGADPMCVFETQDPIELKTLKRRIQMCKERQGGDKHLFLARFLMGEQFWQRQSDDKLGADGKERLMRFMVEKTSAMEADGQSSARWGKFRTRVIRPDDFDGPAPDEQFLFETILLFTFVGRQKKQPGLWLLGPSHGLAIEIDDMVFGGPFSANQTIRFQKANPPQKNGCWLVCRLEKRPWEECSGCGRGPSADAAQFQRCGKCMRVSYCSRECQKSHWKTHKMECRIFATPRAPSRAPPCAPSGSASIEVD